MYKTVHRLGAVALAVSVTAILVACGGGGDAEPEPAVTGETISVIGTEFAFDPPTLSAPADTEFTVEFANNGTMEHDFVIEGQSSDSMAVGPGSKSSGTFTLAAGTYKFFCSIPGHEAAGMVGTLTIE